MGQRRNALRMQSKRSIPPSKQLFTLRTRGLKSYEEHLSSTIYDDSDLLDDFVYDNPRFSQYCTSRRSPPKSESATDEEEESDMTDPATDSMPSEESDSESARENRIPTNSSASNAKPTISTRKSCLPGAVKKSKIYKRTRGRIDYNEINAFKNICNLEVFDDKLKASSSRSSSRPSSPSKRGNDSGKHERSSSRIRRDDHNAESSSASSDEETLKKKYNIKPVELDSKVVDLDFVAGLDDCIGKLKEMVTYPLLYPQFYEKVGIAPPRGVLFHGPPGTGKTLVARALAKFCLNFGQEVSFYVRNGGDCLSKYIGEAERNIRLLFEEARKHQPSIIFFDEIDAIAPARSSKNEQTHLSVVATLLAEMDGLTDRGQIVVIGATNRINSLDPALRRPGRFDREFYFPMPCKEARKRILDSHTRNWDLDDSLKEDLADITHGYSGSDIKGLCLEAATKAFNKKVSDPKWKPNFPSERLEVSIADFMNAFKEIVPSTRRISSNTNVALGRHSKILISTFVRDITGFLKGFLQKIPILERSAADGTGSVYKNVKSALENIDYETFYSFKPRILIEGIPGMQVELVALHSFNFIDNVTVHNLDILNLYDETLLSPEANLIRILNEAKSRTPSIIFVPSIDFWWDRITKTMRNIFIRFINAIHPREPVILVVTTETTFVSQPKPLQEIFAASPAILYRVSEVPRATRKTFFESIFYRINKLFPHKNTLNSDVIRLHGHFEKGIQAALNRLPNSYINMFDGLLQQVLNYSFSYVDDFLDAYNRTVEKFDWQQESHLIEGLKEFMHTHIHTIDLQLIMKYSRTTSDFLCQQPSSSSSSTGGGLRKRRELVDLGKSAGENEESNCGIPDLFASSTASATIEDLERMRIEIEKYAISKTSIAFNELLSLVGGKAQRSIVNKD